VRRLTTCVGQQSIAESPAVSIEIDHSGRVALVTGGAAGIGREIAIWLASAGAHVAVIDRRGDKTEQVVAEIEAAGGSAEGVQADFRNDAEIDAAVGAVASRNNGLDIAVNNIGMFPPGRGPKPFVQTRGDDWRDVIDQNLVTAALSARAEAEAMAGRAAPGPGREGGDGSGSDDTESGSAGPDDTRSGSAGPDDTRSGSAGIQRPGGVIVFVSSGETTRPSPQMATYAAAKAGINHLTTSLAVELGPLGIRVLAVAPGTTDTETVAAALSRQQLDAMAAANPLPHRVRHDELARLVVFLASDLARAITGQLILADSGAFLSRSRPALPS